MYYTCIDSLVHCPSHLLRRSSKTQSLYTWAIHCMNSLCCPIRREEGERGRRERGKERGEGEREGRERGEGGREGREGESIFNIPLVSE